MHHANLLVGDKISARISLPLEVQIESADVLHYEYERMSIADVRELTKEVLLKPISAPQRIFVITAQSILGDAQNALLKIFEEPNAHTVFYLIIPREDMLLPTLRSRLNSIVVKQKTSDTSVFEEFLKMSYSSRLNLIAEKIKSEDAEWVNNILSGVELHGQKMRDARLIEDVLLVDSFVYASGSSKKMLLEHLALTLEAYSKPITA